MSQHQVRNGYCWLIYAQSVHPMSNYMDAIKMENLSIVLMTEQLVVAILYHNYVALKIQKVARGLSCPVKITFSFPTTDDAAGCSRKSSHRAAYHTSSKKAPPKRGFDLFKQLTS